jgi:hypothetical protein
MRGYRAMINGHHIIELSKSILAGGFFDHGLPKIAIVRAGAKRCTVRSDGDDLVFANGNQWWDENRGALVNTKTVRVPLPEDQIPKPKTGRRWSGETVVPIIPPDIRPEQKRLHLYHILWEVEEWTLTAPRDPALLKYIAGDLWEVHDMWDLTDLERAVLSR